MGGTWASDGVGSGFGTWLGVLVSSGVGSGVGLGHPGQLHGGKMGEGAGREHGLAQSGLGVTDRRSREARAQSGQQPMPLSHLLPLPLQLLLLPLLMPLMLSLLFPLPLLL